MQHSNVIDVPRPAGSDDLLGVDRYVSALVRFISVARMPTTLAIQGEWGSGKTSLMNQVRYQLCEMPDTPDLEKPYYGIWINTWQYSLMKSPEAALISVLQGVTGEVLEIMRIRHQSKLTSAINKVGGIFGKLAKIGAKAAASTVGVDASVVDELAAFTESSGSGPAAFRKALSDAIAECLEEDRKAGNSNRGFIFFIDDLDRLDPPVAVQILELLKNLFEVNNCIFILAIDYEVVVKGLEPKFGPLTEKNEREFRSFFDKIIQLPFSMPLSNYKIDSYLSSALVEIGYFTKEELSAPSGNGTLPLIESLSEMTLLSTGTNPRSVKRLINSLSLIQIMQDTAAQGEPMTAQEKLINFGFVCVQIAYPAIYDMLLYEPDYKNWNERIAKRFRVAQVDMAVQEALGETEEFDEEWELVLFRACQNNAYLAARAYSVSKLLNLIASLIDSSYSFGEEVERILTFAAVTTVSSNERPAQKSGDRIRLETLDEFLAVSRERGVREDILPLIPELVKKFTSLYAERVSLELAPGGISVNVVNNKSRERRLVKIDTRKNSLSVYAGNNGPYTVRTLEIGQDSALPEDFFKKVHKRFRAISLDKPPAFEE